MKDFGNTLGYCTAARALKSFIVFNVSFETSRLATLPVKANILTIATRRGLDMGGLELDGPSY